MRLESSSRVFQISRRDVRRVPFARMGAPVLPIDDGLLQKASTGIGYRSTRWPGSKDVTQAS